jgi:hypothetical protein
MHPNYQSILNDDEEEIQPPKTEKEEENNIYNSEFDYK